MARTVQQFLTGQSFRSGKHSIWRSGGSAFGRLADGHKIIACLAQSECASEEA